MRGSLKEGKKAHRKVSSLVGNREERSSPFTECDLAGWEILRVAQLVISQMLQFGAVDGWSTVLAPHLGLLSSSFLYTVGASATPLLDTPRAAFNAASPEHLRKVRP